MIAQTDSDTGIELKIFIDEIRYAAVGKSRALPRGGFDARKSINFKIRPDALRQNRAQRKSAETLIKTLAAVARPDVSEVCRESEALR